MKGWLLLLLFSISGILSIDDDEELKEQIQLYFNIVKGGLEDVPLIQNIVKMVADSIVDTSVKKEDIKAIQTDLRVISHALNESINEIQVAYEMDIVRKVESDAEVLMQHLDEIAFADNTYSIKRRIDLFLKKCQEILSPFDGVLRMKDQMLKILRMQGDVGVYRSSKKIIKMKNKLNGILNRLVLVDVFRRYYANESIEERKDQIEQWDRNLEEIRKKTENVLEELIDNEYWSKMETIIENGIKRTDSSTLQSMADNLQSSVFDIYSKDRFCIIINEKKLSQKKFTVYTRNENMYTSNEYFVIILRSKLAHKMTPDDFAAFRASAENMQQNDHDICPYNNANFLETVLARNFSAIMVPEYETFNLIMRCQNGTSHVIPSECSAFRSDAWHEDKYSLGVFPL